MCSDWKCVISYPQGETYKGYLIRRNHLVLVPVAHIIVLHNALVPLLLCEVEQVLLGSLQIIRR